MAGNRAGAAKAHITRIEKFGVDHYRKVGALGGAAKVPKGFAVSGKASEAGKIGGAISKRRPR